MKKYYKGNYYRDYKREYSKRGGWLVGRFMDDDRKTTKVAIKFWSFKKGKDTGHPFKHQTLAIECTFVLKGKLSAQIGSKKMILRAGDYLVIHPPLRSNLAIKVLQNAEGLTIKAPSYGRRETVKHI